jgi:hypothetical protein
MRDLLVLDVSLSRGPILPLGRLFLSDISIAYVVCDLFLLDQELIGLIR